MSAQVPARPSGTRVSPCLGRESPTSDRRSPSTPLLDGVQWRHPPWIATTSQRASDPAGGKPGHRFAGAGAGVGQQCRGPSRSREELPDTIKRSPKRAQNTWIKAHDSAVETYGEGRRAHQTAFAALKHSFEKVGDHWEPKGRKGPSDRQATRRRGQTSTGTAAGVDANASKAHLMDVAKRLDVSGRSRMTKDELVKAIRRANARETRRARQR